MVMPEIKPEIKPKIPYDLRVVYNPTLVKPKTMMTQWSNNRPIRTCNRRHTMP